MKKVWILALGMGVAHAASALEIDWSRYTVSAGFVNIRLDVKSGNLSAPAFITPAGGGTQANVTDDTQPMATINYRLNEEWDISVPLGLGFKHDMQGAGAIAGVGKIGEVKALPITIFAQRKFAAWNESYHPYLGVGLTYAKFYKARGTAVLTNLTNAGGPATTLKVDSKFALSFQAGLRADLDENRFLDIYLIKTPLKTRTTLSTGQTLDARLDPLSVGVQLGKSF